MAENIIEVNDGSFEEQVLKSATPVLIDFWAPWCGPCRALTPTLEALAEDYKGRVKIVKMNVDENANVPATVGVRSIPFIALYKKGEMIDSLVGAVPKSKLSNMIEKALS